MPERKLLPLMLARSNVMHIPRRQVNRSVFGGITMERVHLNTRLPWENRQIRRRFWMPDAEGARHWGWATVPARCWLADAAPGWHWVRIKVEEDGQGGITLFAFEEEGLESPITPAD